VFFGYDPPDFDLDLDPRNLVDDARNRSPGFCFLDSLKNPCRDWKDFYAHWLLSISALANEFSEIRNGQLIWRPGPSLKLMRSMDEANNHLELANVIGAGACGRGTDLAYQYLRNSPGSAIRNLQVLYKNLCFVGLQDKTSKKRLHDRYVPSAPPLSVAKLIIFNLGVLRPFQEVLAHQLLGPDHARRFHEALHPRLCGNLTSDALSRRLANTTEEFLHARLPITKWRKIVGTISKRHSDPLAFEISKTYFCDIVAHHSGSTAEAVYQQASGSIEGVSPEHIIGCIKHSIAWQDLTGIDKESPLTVTNVGAGNAQASGQLTLTGGTDAATGTNGE
jgi:hypothetical protein